MICCHISSYICSLLLFQLSPDPTYAEIKKPQPHTAVHPYSTDDDQPPPIPLFRIENEPSLSPSEHVIAQYSVIMREHMTPHHVPPCNTVVEGDDSTQFVSKREETKVIKQLSSLHLLCCYCSIVERTFICSKLKILMFL